MIHFLMQHEFWTAVVAYWIFSAAVSGLPAPAANDQAWYVWLYSFCHTIAGNISNVVGNKIPGLKIPPFAVLTPLVLAVTACTAHYTVHPGALNKVDSAAYDTLLSAQAAINQARLEYDAGRLPQSSKEGLDQLVQVFNAARASWLAYRDVAQTNVSPDPYFTELNKNLADLALAIRNLKEKK